MSTPRFNVSQDENFVYVHVHVPYVRVSDMEFTVDGSHFMFYCKPYLLKLEFPHAVVDDDNAKAVYDPNKENGTITVHLPKEMPGQHFEDLDMLTKLLIQPRPNPLATPEPKSSLIEVISSPTSQDGDKESTFTEETATKPQTDDSLLNLEQKQTLYEDHKTDSIHVTDLKPSYGFNNAYSEFFRAWHGAVSEIVSNPDPDNLHQDERRRLRQAAEEEQFDIEHYLMDYMGQDEDPYFTMAMEYTPFWTKYPVVRTKGLSEQLQTLQIQDTAKESTDLFSEDDQELLLRLPRKEYLIEKGSREEAVLLGGLVDILIGYTYDHLTTQGESNIESTWTASIVSPTLSWLDSTANLDDVVRSGVRRMISFPLLRQFDLARRVLDETLAILERGKRMVLRVLLDLYRIVEKSETQYLLNTLYIQDYCVWVQCLEEDRFLQVAKELRDAISRFTKESTGWALEEMEKKVKGEVEEDSDSSSEASSDSEEEEEES